MRGIPGVTQRARVLRSSGPAGSRSRAAIAASLATAAGIRVGSFPSGGSTICDVRLSNSRSTMKLELRFAPRLRKASTSARAARYRASPMARSASFSVKIRFARRDSSATSSSVRNCLPSRACGRSNGVALVFNQTPCRSGWPSAVRGTVHGPAATVDEVSVPPARPWPAAGWGSSEATAKAVVSRAALTNAKRLSFILVLQSPLIDRRPRTRWPRRSGRGRRRPPPPPPASRARRHAPREPQTERGECTRVLSSPHLSPVRARRRADAVRTADACGETT